LYNPQLYFLHLLHCGLYNPQYNFFFKYIADCTNRNTFRKNFVLRVVQPAIYLKKICVTSCITCFCGVIVVITIILHRFPVQSWVVLIWPLNFCNISFIIICKKNKLVWETISYKIKVITTITGYFYFFLKLK